MVSIIINSILISIITVCACVCVLIYRVTMRVIQFVLFDILQCCIIVLYHFNRNRLHCNRYLYLYVI